jgi:alanyl-tRNA synthetase
MDPRHAIGRVGEQSSGFYFGRLGYVAITGPSGSGKGGHGVTSPGFDGVFYNPKTDHLIIADNKACSKDGKMVYSASAIDKNFSKNITKTLKEMKNIQMPAQMKARVTQLLKQAQNSKTAPSNVTRVVQNAHGLGLKGIAGKLAGTKLVFVPFEKVFQDSKGLMNYCANYKSNSTTTQAKNLSAKSSSASTTPANSATKATKTANSNSAMKSVAKSIQNKTVGRTLAKTSSAGKAAATMTFRTSASSITSALRRGR